MDALGTKYPTEWAAEASGCPQIPLITEMAVENWVEARV